MALALNMYGLKDHGQQNTPEGKALQHAQHVATETLAAIDSDCAHDWNAQMETRTELQELSCVDLSADLAEKVLEVIRAQIEIAARDAKEQASSLLLKELAQEEALKKERTGRAAKKAIEKGKNGKRKPPKEEPLECTAASGNTCKAEKEHTRGDACQAGHRQKEVAQLGPSDQEEQVGKAEEQRRASAPLGSLDEITQECSVITAKNSGCEKPGDLQVVEPQLPQSREKEQESRGKRSRRNHMPASKERHRFAGGGEMRIVSYSGVWECTCGQLNSLRAACVCGQKGPCRDWVRGRCNHMDECSSMSLPAQLVDESQPTSLDDTISGVVVSHPDQTASQVSSSLASLRSAGTSDTAAACLAMIGTSDHTADSSTGELQQVLGSSPFGADSHPVQADMTQGAPISSPEQPASNTHQGSADAEKAATPNACTSFQMPLDTPQTHTDFEEGQHLRIPAYPPANDSPQIRFIVEEQQTMLGRSIHACAVGRPEGVDDCILDINFTEVRGAAPAIPAASSDTAASPWQGISQGVGMNLQSLATPVPLIQDSSAPFGSEPPGKGHMQQEYCRAPPQPCLRTPRQPGIAPASSQAENHHFQEWKPYAGAEYEASSMRQSSTCSAPGPPLSVLHDAAATGGWNPTRKTSGDTMPARTQLLPVPLQDPSSRHRRTAGRLLPLLVEAISDILAAQQCIFQTQPAALQSPAMDVIGALQSLLRALRDQPKTGRAVPAELWLDLYEALDARSGKVGPAYLQAALLLEQLDACSAQGIYGSPVSRTFALIGQEVTNCSKCMRVLSRPYAELTKLLPTDVLKSLSKLPTSRRCTFEDLLLSMDANAVEGHCPQELGGCAAPSSSAISILKLPEVFVVAMAWGQEALAIEDYAAVLDSIPVVLDFGTVCQGSWEGKYRLHTMVCCSADQHWRVSDAGSGWMVVRGSQERRVLDSWAAVLAQCAIWCMLPLFLFFESV